MIYPPDFRPGNDGGGNDDGDDNQHDGNPPRPPDPTDDAARRALMRSRKPLLMLIMLVIVSPMAGTMVGSIVAGILDARVITMVSDCRNIRSELYEMWADDVRTLAFRIGPDIIPAECFRGTIDNMRAAIQGRMRPQPFRPEQAEADRVPATTRIHARFVGRSVHAGCERHLPVHWAADRHPFGI